MTKKRAAVRTTYKEWITDEGLLKIEGWARDGLINEQIAENIGIAEGTLYRWINDHSEIRESLKRGKEVVDRQVENALLKRALGYTYEEVREEDIIIDGGKISGGKVTRTRKAVVPDTTAQIFWLKNRKPAEWRDKQNIEHSGEMTQLVKNEIDLSTLSVEELKELETIISKTTSNDTAD